jgi:hypothetical protein
MPGDRAPFSDVPRTPRGHLGLRFYEAAFAVLRHLRARAVAAGRDLDAVLSDFPFLAGYLAELDRRLPEPQDWNDRAVRLEREIDAWEEASLDVWLPLRALGRAGLERTSLAALVFSGLAEEEAGFGDVFAAAQPGNGSPRPTIGLLRTLISTGSDSCAADPWQLAEPLLARGLADVLNRDAPRSVWLLRIPGPIWAAIRGDRVPSPAAGIRHTPITELEGIAQVILPDAVIERLRELAALVESGRSRCVVVRGTPGTDRLAVVAAVAHATGRGLLQLSPGPTGDERSNLAGPLATLLRAMPVFAPELGPTDTFTVPSLGGYDGAVGIILGLEGGLAGGDRAVTVTLPADPIEIRRRRWMRELDERGAGEVEAIARSFAVSGGLIREYARLARAYADLSRRDTVAVDDVRQAARTFNRQQLDALAARLDVVGGWEQLVLPDRTMGELRDLESRCRQREPLVSAVGGGFPGGLNRGVRGLLEGASGTGKTLAARALASELGMDVYRVDLAAVVNKYVGETEKNLSRVLSRAEDLDVVLLLDEGDALLARRTDVRTSNDRYANFETNYLLQRLETYQGIVLITTNLGGQIDPAFRRRMDVVVKFQLPEPPERWQIWTLHLPPGHRIPADALEEIAGRFTLTGAQIRNAVVYASLLALDAGRSLEHNDLVTAIQVEHRKAGASLPACASPPPPDGAAGLRGFLELIA